MIEHDRVGEGTQQQILARAFEVQPPADQLGIHLVAFRLLDPDIVAIGMGDRAERRPVARAAIDDMPVAMGQQQDVAGLQRYRRLAGPLDQAAALRRSSGSWTARQSPPKRQKSCSSGRTRKAGARVVSASRSPGMMAAPE
jgi:hypothetical protein